MKGLACNLCHAVYCALVEDRSVWSRSCVVGLGGPVMNFLEEVLYIYINTCNYNIKKIMKLIYVWDPCTLHQNSCYNDACSNWTSVVRCWDVLSNHVATDATAKCSLSSCFSGDVLRPGQVPSNKTCDAACSSHSTCENCTRASCMWCGNQAQCVESNAYVSSFPYGQCMEWTTIINKCSGQCCMEWEWLHAWLMTVCMIDDFTHDWWLHAWLMISRMINELCKIDDFTHDSSTHYSCVCFVGTIVQIVTMFLFVFGGSMFAGR